MTSDGTPQPVHAQKGQATGSHPKPAETGMPKWLLYGFIAKLVLVVVITLGVLYYAGIL